MMKPAAGLAGGMFIGASTMFLLDPRRGHSRRAYLRDQFYHFGKVSLKNFRVVMADLGHRSQGLIAISKTKITRPEVLDDVLVERVRARLGHIVSYPRSIEAHVKEGKVILKGQALPEEMDIILSHIRSVPGVKDIVNELNLFDESMDLPELQGFPKGPLERRVEQFPFGNIRSPGVRFLIGSVAGGALTWFAYHRKKVA